jgi:hypothetical protein
VNRHLVCCLLTAALAASAAVPCAAQNLVVNPGFITDLSGWTVLVNPAFIATHDTSQSYNTPGSLKVATPGSTDQNYVAVRQCVPVAPGQVVDYGGLYRFESGHAANLKGFVSATWFTDAACTTGATVGPSSNTVNDIPDTWLPIHANNVVVPAGFNSALFLIVIGMTAGESVGWFDDVYFGPDPLAVELLTFEIVDFE